MAFETIPKKKNLIIMYSRGPAELVLPDVRPREYQHFFRNQPRLVPYNVGLLILRNGNFFEVKQKEDSPPPVEEKTNKVKEVKK